jgi:hypothetical protein
MQEDATFYKSHGQMRLSVYAALHGIDAVAFPLDGGVGALLDVAKLNARFKDRDLVEDRVLMLMQVFKKHPRAFQPFLLVGDNSGRKSLYALDESGKRWVNASSRMNEIIAAAEDGERL